MADAAMKGLIDELEPHFKTGGRLWLFLDYDGTLAEFAPTPDTIIRDQELVGLIERLAQFPECVRVVILSGRRYSHIARLLPVPGILKAGTYGIEFQDWSGEVVHLIDFKAERPFLDQVKTEWEALVKGHEGFFVEDKGFAIALHGSRAEDRISREVLKEAARLAHEVAERGTFRVEGSHKFLEVAPVIANKGQSINTLLKRFPWPNARAIYFGDDAKDEDAFKAIRAQGGTAVLVAKEARETSADRRIAGPAAVRAWLVELANLLERVV